MFNMLRNSVLFLFLLLPSTIISDGSQQTAFGNLTPMQQLATAGTMSTVNALVDSPLNFWKYRLQYPKLRDTVVATAVPKPISAPNAAQIENVTATCSAINPFAMWRGSSINVVRAFPNVAAQISIMSGANKVAEQNPELKKSAIASVVPPIAAGVASGLIATPTDLVIMNRQNSGKSSVSIVKNIAQNHGMSSFFRGALAKMGRNIPNSLAYWHLAPKVGEKIKPHMPNEAAAKIVANVAVGIPMTALNHPFDTISTVMQCDLGKHYYKHFTQTASALYAQGNSRLYSGLKSRLIGAAVGFPLARLTQDYMTNVFAQRNATRSTSTPSLSV